MNFRITWTGDVNVIYWKFDTDGNEIQSGFTNSLVHTKNFGTVTSTQTDTNTDLNQANLSQFTWEAKMLWSTGNVGTLAYGKGSTLGTVFGYVFQGLPGTQTIQLRRYDGTGGPGTLLIDSGTSITADTNYLVKVIRTSASLMTFYVNGVSVGTATDGTYADFNTMIAQSTNGQYNDINFYRAAFTPFSSPNYYIHNFSTIGAKRIQVTLQNVDGNASTHLDLNLAANIRFIIWDENTLTRLAGASLDFNGGTYTSDANGVVSIPITSGISGTYSLDLDVNSQYQSRSFVYDLNQASSLDVNLLALKTNAGLLVDFELYKPDQATLFPINSIVEMRYNNNAIIGGISGRLKIPSNQITTFFLQQYAQDYNIYIISSDTNVVYTYLPTQLTINIPKDEVNSFNLTPYNISISGIGGFSYSSLSGALTIPIFTDTEQYYSVQIDKNSQYYPRTYLIKTLGGPGTYSLQPYLLAIADGIQVKFVTLEALTEKILPHIRIQSRTDINGISTLIEDLESDGTGVATLSFEPNIDYNITFLQDDIIIFSTSYIPNADDVIKRALLGVQVISVEPGDEVAVDVNFGTNASTTLTPNASNIVTITETINEVLGDINRITIVYTHNDTTIATDTYNISDSNVFPITISKDLSVSGLDQTYPITITTTTIVDSKTVTSVSSFTIQTYSNNLFQSFINGRNNDIGLTLTTMFAILCAAIFVGLVVNASQFTNPTGQVVIALPILFFFFLVQWINPLAFGLGSLLALIISWGNMGGSGN